MNVADLLDRPIAFQRAFVRLGAGVTGALMLSQALYWSRRTGEDTEWFFKTQVEWEEETGLTRYEQEGARAKLVKLGVLEEMKKGVPCKLFYRVNLAVLSAILHVEFPQASQRKTTQPVCGKPANKAVENQQSIKEETTSETTAEKGDKRTPAAHAPVPGVPESLVHDWIAVRKAKRAGPITDTVIAGVQREAERAGLSLEAAIRVATERGWQGFRADWYAQQQNAQPGRQSGAHRPAASRYAGAAAAIFDPHPHHAGPAARHAGDVIDV